MTALHDALQQAREANVEAGRRLLTMTPEDRATLRALGELIVTLGETLPHLVDTRRIVALAPSEPKYLEDVCLSFQPPDGWCVLIDDEAAPGQFFSTAAEALDAAEREAGR